MQERAMAMLLLGALVVLSVPTILAVGDDTCEYPGHVQFDTRGTRCGAFPRRSGALL